MTTEGEQFGIGQNSLQPIEKSSFQLVHWIGDLANATGIHPPQFVHGGLLYWAGLSTSTLSDSSIPLRNTRTETFHKMQGITLSYKEAKPIFDRERERKRITRELYDHHLVEVETSYGSLGGQVSVLNPDVEGRPIIYIPGSSSDPESVESGAVSLALLSKQKVIILGWTDAANGKTTNKFSGTVIHESIKATQENPPSYAPYVEYFDTLIHSDTITSLIGGNGTFDIWCHSAGGPVTAKLLSQQKYQERVQNAVFLNPAGSATFAPSKPEEVITALKTLASQLKPLHRYPRFTFWQDPRSPKQSKDKRMKFDAWIALMSQTHYKIPEWKTINTQRSIVVFSGGRDFGTRSFETFNDTDHEGNDAIHVLFDQNAHHVTPFTHPDETVQKILDFQMHL